MVIYAATRRSDENIADISWGQAAVMKIVQQVEVIKILLVYDKVKNVLMVYDDVRKSDIIIRAG